eukprot:gene2204-5215_t
MASFPRREERGRSCSPNSIFDVTCGAKKERRRSDENASSSFSNEPEKNRCSFGRNAQTANCDSLMSQRLW